LPNHQVVLTTLKHRRLLGVAAIGAFLVVFTGFVFLERPGLGVAHFFYLPIGLLALASGPRIGAIGGALATVLFAAGIYLNPYVPPSELATASTAIRFFTFVLIGSAFGWFARGNRELFESLQAQAYQDFLTDLPNARAFHEELAGRIASKEPFAVVLVDADGLKAVNDEAGHDEGDRMLRDIADALRRSTRREDLVSRLAGDEFAVIMESRASMDAAELCARFEEAISAIGRRATVGFGQFPEDGNSGAELYRAADRRLYERKPSRRTKRPVFPHARSIPG
jgi:diguanylate cyclase (GGDEF)-like protein